MYDNILRTAYRLKSFADKLFTRLHQNLYGYVIGNMAAFNQGTQNFVLCFRGGRKANLDFLKAAIYQGVEKANFFRNAHRCYQCLVAVAQINTAPYRCFCNRFIRPLTVGNFYLFKRNIFFLLLHD